MAAIPAEAERDPPAARRGGGAVHQPQHPVELGRPDATGRPPVVDVEGDFFLGTKRERGYFFHKKGGGGDVLREGKKLHGAGKKCLPGGGKEEGGSGNAIVKKEAGREFKETRHVLNTDRDIEDFTSNKWTYGGGAYFAGYYRTSTAHAQQINGLVDPRLVRAGQIAEEIAAGRITDYESVQRNDVPPDNELASCEIWNVHTRWSDIDAWKEDDELNWYREILLHLKTKLLGARLVGAPGG